MKSARSRRALAVACAVLVTAGAIAHPESASARADAAWAITNARIVVGTGAVVERGTVVIRDGLIAAVGASVPVPPDAVVVEGDGLTVYPGLVDALVASEPEAKQENQSRQAARVPDRENPPGVTPERDALTLLKPGPRYEAMRDAGVTTVLLAPPDGIFQGKSALVNLEGGDASKMALKRDVALHVGFDTQGGFGIYPSSLMGVVSIVRQKLLDAGHYKLVWERYDKQPRGVPRPEPSAQLEALVPVLERKTPVVMNASVDRDIRRALSLAREFNLQPIIAGGLEAWKTADALKATNAPVLLTLNFPERPADQAPEATEPLRVVQARVEAPMAAARLHQAGVKFAFQSGGLRQPRQYLANAIKAVKAGLPKDEALRAMTIRPAEIFGVAEQIGSVETGKIANLVVTNGDLFDEKTKLRYVFVDGVRHEIRDDAPPAGKPGETAAIDVTGNWTIQIAVPEAPQTASLVLAQQGTAVTGTLSTPMTGSVDVRSGAVAGKRLTFTITVTIQGTVMEVAFDGTVEGNSMEGTATVAGQGSFGFSGTRPQKGGAYEE